MKILRLLLILSLAPPAMLRAQVALEQEQFLPGETMPVAVRITNHSRQTLHFGGEPNWLTFSVESADSFVVVFTGMGAR